MGWEIFDGKGGTQHRRFVPDKDLPPEALAAKQPTDTSLLRRYMQHIVNEESVAYVGPTHDKDLRALFSAEEIELLRKLSREIGAKDAPY
jgi:hypothetical protein